MQHPQDAANKLANLSTSAESRALQHHALHDQAPDEETLHLILESIRDGADDTDEDEMQQAILLSRQLLLECAMLQCCTRHTILHPFQAVCKLFDRLICGRCACRRRSLRRLLRGSRAVFQWLPAWMGRQRLWQQDRRDAREQRQQAWLSRRPGLIL